MREMHCSLSITFFGRKENSMNFTPLQQMFLAEYKCTPLAQKFYLTGGTLLAVRYLHHRHSLDLDFFANAPVELRKLQPIMKRIVTRAGIAMGEYRRVADRHEWDLHYGKEDTKVEFVFYDFKPLKPRLEWNGIFIDTLGDIAANKAFALIERHEPKDIFDIYYLIQKTKWNLPKFLKLMHKKFGLKIDEQTLLADAELALQRLDAVRGLLLTETPADQKEIFKKIHRYFDDVAYKYLRERLGD